jgi:hypothetical protein
MLKTYNCIFKLHHVENREYSIIHLLSPICTSLDNLKSKEKSTIIILKSTWRKIKYVINQYHCDKIKNHTCVEYYYF